MTEKYLPKMDERAKYLFECADRAVEKINNLTEEQRHQHFQELAYGIAEVNQHSYKINLGQARTLTKYEFVRYIG